MSTPDPFPEKSASWQRRKAARPKEILEAALKVFAERGFSAARMSDIAARAGVTKGTIYLYFPGKEDVFKTLARETVGAFLADFERQIKTFSGSARDMLVLTLRTFSAFMSNRDRAALPKIIISESGNFPDLAKFWSEEVIGTALKLITSIYRRGIETGEFRALPPKYVVRICIAPAVLGIIWRTTFDAVLPETLAEPLDTDEFLTTQIDILLRGISTEGHATP